MNTRVRLPHSNGGTEYVLVPAHRETTWYSLGDLAGLLTPTAPDSHPLYGEKPAKAED